MRTLYLLFFSTLNLMFIVIVQFITLFMIGPSTQTDALFAGMTIPAVILSIINSALSNVLIPIFTAAKDQKRILWQMIYVFFGFTTVIALLLIFSWDFWGHLVFNGFTRETLQLTFIIIATQLLVLPLSTCSAIISAYLNANSKFVANELIPATCSLLLLPVAYFTIPAYGVIATSYLYAFKIVITFITQCILTGAPHKFSFNKDESIKIFHQLKPLLVGSIYYKSGPIIDRNILSNTAPGILSLFVLAQQLFSMGSIILTKTIIIPQITQMNMIRIRGNSKLWVWLFRRILITLLGTSIFYLLYVFFGKPILSFVFEILNINKIDLDILWLITIFLFGSFIGDFSSTLVSAGFYCQKDTRTPSVISIITYTTFIPVKYLSFYAYGVYGLATAISINALLNLVTLLFYFRKENI